MLAVVSQRLCSCQLRHSLRLLFQLLAPSSSIILTIRNTWRDFFFPYAVYRKCYQLPGMESPYLVL